MLNSKYLINSRIKINRLIINNMYIIKAVSHVMCILIMTITIDLSD